MPGKYSHQTITAVDMRSINRSAVLECIRSHGPISRYGLATELQVSLPTLMRIIKELCAEGLIKETEKKEWSGGRKRVEYIFNGSEHQVIGIDLGGTKIYGAISDFNGNFLHEISFEHHKTQSEESLQVVFQVIDQLLKVAVRRNFPVRGIGIGVPGITDPNSGVVSLAPALNWYDFPLKACLFEKYSYPVIIENDVNLAALGEAWFGSEESREQNLVLIAIGTGIGAGIVINGSIYSGVHHLAGEIGYLLLDRRQLGRPYPGFGAFEQIASGTGIANRGRLSLQNRPILSHSEPVSAEGVFVAARLNEPWAQEIVSETVDYLAQAIAAITLLYDPEVVLLGGGVSRSADLLITPIQKRLAGAIPIIPKIQVSRLGYRACVLGAVIQILRTTTDFSIIRKYT